jgi:hypothetical protein
MAGTGAGTVPVGTPAPSASPSTPAAVRAQALAESPLPARLQVLGRNTARHSGFPLGVLVALVLFLLLQDQIDRRDPKLALAPEYDEPDLPFERPPPVRPDLRHPPPDPPESTDEQR